MDALKPNEWLVRIIIRKYKEDRFFYTDAINKQTREAWIGTQYLGTSDVSATRSVIDWYDCITDDSPYLVVTKELFEVLFKT